MSLFPTPVLSGSGLRVCSQPQNITAPLNLTSVSRCKGTANRRQNKINNDVFIFYVMTLTLCNKVMQKFV
mgnify:CR=1 FL=1